MSYEKRLMKFLEIPRNLAELEKKYFERSMEIVQLQEFIKSRGLEEAYKQSLEGERKALMFL